jgi:hypothetical protein
MLPREREREISSDSKKGSITTQIGLEANLEKGHKCREEDEEEKSEAGTRR